MDYFGSIRPFFLLERAATDTLRGVDLDPEKPAWLPTYLREVERQWDLDAGQLIDVNTWSRRSWFETIPGDEFLPLIAIVSPGLVEMVGKDGKRRYTGKVRLDVGVVVSEPDEPRELASYYGAAIRACLVQKGLAGLDADVDWIGERPDDLPIEQERSLASCRIQFHVTWRDLVTAVGGPPEPTEDDPGDLGVVETHSETIRPKED